MFSMNKNIYNKKTKGPALMELFTATGKVKKFFLTTRDVRCVDHGWHGSQQYDIRFLVTHVPTWVLWDSSVLQWSVPLSQQSLIAMLLCVLCTKCTVTTDLLVWYTNTQNDFSLERPFFHYIHSHRLAAEMWNTMKNNLLGKKFLSCSFYLYRFCKYLSCGFPIINFCNPGVHYKMPCVFSIPHI